MATGTGNLPYPMSPVSPFDVITSQAENERIANIESLADGTGIGDKSVTADKIDFTNLGSAMVEKTTGAFTTTSGSFVNITGASVSFTKQQDTTRILVSMTVVSSVSATGVGSQFAVNINSTDYRVVVFDRTTTTTLSAGGSRVITGVPAGTYTVNGRALVGGGVTLDIGANKYVLISIAEF